VTGRIEDTVACDSYVGLEVAAEVVAPREGEQGKDDPVDLSHLKDDPNELRILLSNYDPKKTSVFDCRAYFEKFDAVTFEKDLKAVLREVYDFLITQNKAYGDASLNPVKVFSRSDSVEQLKVRIDDKLSRFIKGAEYPEDDDERELLADLVLLQIARRREEHKDD
jgi:hypothetical protein